MKNLLIIFIRAYVFFICLFLIGCKEQEEVYIPKEPSEKLAIYFDNQLDSAFRNLDSIQYESVLKNKKEHYKRSRIHFKKAEPLLAFLDRENYKSLNAPNILKVEEEDLTNIKVKHPFGYQVIEEELYAENLDSIQLQKTLKYTLARLQLVKNNTRIELKDYHILWLVREELVRIATLGITGFDSPVLESSMKDATSAYEGIDEILQVYSEKFQDDSLMRSWQKEIDDSRKSLNEDFESFDRYSFIKNHIHYQLKLWTQTVEDWKVNFPFELAISNSVTSLFSDQTFNLDYFSGYDDNLSFTEEKKVLGRDLFKDKRLSKSQSISCASCHQMEKVFTDGLKTFPGQIRNTPSVKYAALQKAFFYDNRAGSLEGQIVSVVNNENEFHTNLEQFTEVVKKDSGYNDIFSKIYRHGVTDANIRNAIASYIRSLSPLDSKFDRNINDLENSLTKQEINGFNLFMGKAKCATCHFAPVFNGTVPPDFRDTEMEMLGVPRDTSLTPVIDNDLGRFQYFQTSNRKHFFKTPTIRNISETGPYMHNGVYNSLEQVIEFYNNGGGTGLGIEAEYQTLPPDSLKLSKSEIKNLIAFMESLKDK